LLEDHLESKNAEGSDAGLGAEFDEEDGWEGWDVESDSDESSSASEGWIEVESDSEELYISDSDDEENQKRKNKGNQKNELVKDELEAGRPEARVSTLATTKVGSLSLTR
jgi:protein SDA1